MWLPNCFVNSYRGKSMVMGGREKPCESVRTMIRSWQEWQRLKGDGGKKSKIKMKVKNQESKISK